ncbi:MAG TPA: hypothetical protein VHD62_08940 [Opitutaceae bacterium]|nr:hypothetical protein [Opitutaceae bacterium]
MTAGPPSARLFQSIVEATDESATVSVLLDLCRTSPALRLWLYDDFARDPARRAEFARVLKATDRPVQRFAELSGDGAGWQDERQRLRARLAGATFGGLTFDQLKELIVRYQAGRGEPAAFLLAIEWRRHRRSGPLPPRLVRAAADFLDAALAPGGAVLLRQLARAVELAESFGNRARLRAALGFTDWWKLNLLLYLMRHPAPSYRTRDLLRHLTGQGLRVSSRALRQFCTEHGIVRDMRPGRPSPDRSTAARAIPPPPSRPQRRRPAG